MTDGNVMIENRKLDQKNQKKIIQLKERLIDLIEITSMYESLPSFYFNKQINEILIELEDMEEV